MSTLSRIFFLLLGAILALLAGLLLPGLNPEQSLMAGLFTLALVYWISEPIPLYVTGILVAFLEALLLGALAEPLGLEARNYRIFLAPFSSPVVVLLFGGFVMARVFSKHNLDLELARVVLGRMGNRPSVLLLAFMLLTAVMSMWMSNTATTAIMVAAILPLVRRMPEGSNLPKAFLLAIPFAANVGGIATPVGTPPNAIALGLLSENGFSLSFFAWMTAAF
ncbi:MAG: SLC13 family permease, partial [Candidatus Krumholzibacteria bacterium]|nr:SLC13 family permease [Candidatus Krumholzibacteria bacterium]